MGDEFYVGLMSGTSLDGLDLALVCISDPFALEVVDFRHLPFGETVRDAMLQWNQASQWRPDTFVAMNHALGRLYGDAVRLFLADHQDIAIRAVGMHGITVHHCPDPVDTPLGPGRGTLQLGDPHLVSALCGLPVIYDFRHADMALGGQGAPLAPYVDHLLFRHPQRGRILLNLGGIANLSFLTPHDERVWAFDSGPANMVVDALMRQHPNNPGPYDPEGRLAAAGTVIEPLLETCLEHDYFARKPPKSTGREEFGDSFTRMFLDYPGDHSYEDLLATATYLTAVTVADAVKHQGPDGAFHDLIASGGGAHNRTLMNMIARVCPHLEVSSTRDHGVDTDAKEAILMATLAHAHCHGIPANFPTVTGASGKVVLGARTHTP